MSETHHKKGSRSGGVGSSDETINLEELRKTWVTSALQKLDAHFKGVGAVEIQAQIKELSSLLHLAGGIARSSGAPARGGKAAEAENQQKDLDALKELFVLRQCASQQREYMVDQMRRCPEGFQMPVSHGVNVHMRAVRSQGIPTD